MTFDQADPHQLVGKPCKVRRSAGDVTPGVVSQVHPLIGQVVVEVEAGMAKMVPIAAFLDVNPEGFDALR